MQTKINLEGEWKLQLDETKQGLTLPFTDVITLPGTTSYARNGPKNEEVLVSALTDEYLFEGQVWFAREVFIPDELAGKACYLFLERTRLTTLWLDNTEIGSRNSLNTPHIYELPKLQAGIHTITVRVDNTDYPTKGGHLTSQDTQTNWNGITGRMELQFYGESQLTNIRLESNLAARTVRITATLDSNCETTLAVSAQSFNSEETHTVDEREFPVSPGLFPSIMC